MSLAYDIAVALGKGQEPATNGKGWLTFCPAHDDMEGGKPSLSIVDSDESHGLTVLCHVGCKWQDIKDALAERGLIEKFNGSKVSAARITTNAADDPRPSPSPPPRKSGQFPWEKATVDEASISLIKKYFSGRKIFFTDKFPLPRCFRWGSYKDKNGEQVYQIVCAATKPDEKKVEAVQRLFMEIEGDIVVKTGMKMLGECKHRGIWFNRHGSMEDLIVAEGIETTLSVMQATGYNGVAGLSAAGMKAIVLPEGIKRLYVCVDSDPGYAGQKAGIALAERVAKEYGNKVIVYIEGPCGDCFSDHPTKMDFNDSNQETIELDLITPIKIEHMTWRPPEKKKDTADGYYTEKTLRRLMAINKEYAVLYQSNGNCCILREAYNEVTKRHDIGFSTKAAFDLYFENEELPVKVNDETKLQPVSKLWRKWAGRRTFNNVVFAPGHKLSKGTYNLFRGFPLKAKEGDWHLMRDHIEKIICDSIQDNVDYLLAWMARAVQDPGGERAGVAVVLKGGRGTGKGVFAKTFGKIFGESFCHISSEEGFTGKFNIHLSKALLVFLDEAVFAGSKKSEGRLKALITEETMAFEPKGMDQFQLQNYMNVLMASNERWVVPAGNNERRFFVLNVNESEEQKDSYFKPLYQEINNGGVEAMYDFLLKYDYSKVNLREAPKTKGLSSQVEQTFDTVQSFWYDVLSRGYLLTDFNGNEAYTSFVDEDNLMIGEIAPEPELWPKKVYKVEIYNEFLKFCKNENKQYKKTNEVHFWRRTYEVCGRENFIPFKKKTESASSLNSN